MSQGGGYKGIGIHTAARIGAIAETATVARAVSDSREVSLTGLADPLRVVSVEWQA